MAKPRLIIFSDLDGTLLDHNNYDWSAAKPAMERLSASDIPVVLNSSKTISEIRALDRKSTRLNSSHARSSRMPSSA